MSRIGHKDRWKPRYLRLGEPPGRRAGDPKAAPWDQWEALEHKNKLAQLNSAPFIPLVSADYLAGADPLWGIQPGRLIFVPHGFPFSQAIQTSQFLEYLRNLLAP